MSRVADIALEKSVTSLLGAQSQEEPNLSDEANGARDVAFFRIVSQVAQCNERTALLRDAAALVAGLLQLEYCGFASALPGSGLITFSFGKTSSARESGEIQKIELTANEEETSMVACAMASGHPVVTTDLPKDNRFEDTALQSQHIHCGIVCPFVVEGRSTGALGVFCVEPLKFSEADVMLVDAIANLVGSMLIRFDTEDLLASEKQLNAALRTNSGQNGLVVGTANRNSDFPTASSLSAERSGGADRKERRLIPRRPYRCIQRVAPIVEGNIPSVDDFYEVQCDDVSSAGFSFLASSPTKNRNLVVAFGLAPRVTYLTVTVTHETPTNVDGETMLMIGCKFTGRIDIW